MGWTTPITWNTGDLIDAADLNTYLRDNLAFLKDRPGDYFEGTGSDYSTSSTSFTDIDSTDFSITDTFTGDPILVLINAAFGVTSDLYVYFDITVDGARQGGTNDGIWVVQMESTVDPSNAFGLCFVLFGVSSGSRTIRAQWRVGDGAETVTLFAEGGTYQTLPQFVVKEFS